MYHNGLGIGDLVSFDEWQRTQDSLAEALGVTLRTIDLNGKLLTRPSSLPTHLLYEKLDPEEPLYAKFCKSGSIKKEETNLKCPFGLDLFILPIKALGNKTIAYIIVGPVILDSRRPRAEYANEALESGIDPDKLMDALIDINVFTHSKIRAMLDLIEGVFSYIARTGFHKRRLGEIAPEILELDPLFSGYYEEKVLNTLLNTCLIAFDADSGSVMTVDKNTGNLHMKVASKLDKKQSENAHLKMGEGIAGLAAATSEPIILPKDSYRNGLSEKMKRDYIKSSMIVPFNKANKDDVYGVINLNVLRKREDFTDKDIALIKELINLASVALLPVK